MWSAFSSCRLYSWMRLICVSKIDSGSTTCPVADFSQPANRTLASRLALRIAARNALSPASGSSFWSWLEIGDPAVADGVGDHRGERRVREQQEAPLRDAVGLVVEPFGEERGEVGHDGPLEQLRVDRRHAVGAVRADDGEVRHADLLRLAFLDETHARDPCRHRRGNARARRRGSGG